MGWNNCVILILAISLSQILCQKIDQSNNTVALVIELSSDNNSSQWNLKLFDYLQNNSFSYINVSREEFLAQRNQSITVGPFLWNGTNITMTLSNWSTPIIFSKIENTTAATRAPITDPTPTTATAPTSAVNTTNTTIESNSNSSRLNESVYYLFIDVCPTKNFPKLFNLTKSKIYGLYVTYQTPPGQSNRSNQTNPGNKSSLYSNVIPHLNLNQSYLIKFDNVSATNRLWRIFCGSDHKNKNTSIDQQTQQSLDNVTLEECCCTCNWTLPPSRTQNCTNFTAICDLPVNKNKLSSICCRNETSLISATTQSSTGIKDAISSHSNLALVFGLLVLISAVIIVCFVYRRRIRLFLSAFRMRGSAADNESTSIRYGTLKHGDELGGW